MNLVVQLLNRARNHEKGFPARLLYTREDQDLDNEAAAELTRLQKELETAREDALEEAAKVANRKWQEYQGPFGSQAASACGYEIETAIRALKDKEVAG